MKKRNLSLLIGGLIIGAIAVILHVENFGYNKKGSL